MEGDQVYYTVVKVRKWKIKIPSNNVGIEQNDSLSKWLSFRANYDDVETKNACYYVNSVNT